MPPRVQLADSRQGAQEPRRNTHQVASLSPAITQGFCEHFPPSPLDSSTGAASRLAENCDCPNDDHRVSVVSLDDQGSFGVLFCVGPEQDLKRLPSVSGHVFRFVVKTSPCLEVCCIVVPSAVARSAVSGR